MILRRLSFMCLFFCVAVQFPLTAQEQIRDTVRSLEQQILLRRDVDADLIANSRGMLLERVRAGETAGVAELFTFLDQRYRNSRMLPLWPGERILLYYWMHDYRPILDPAYLDQIDTADFNRFIIPPRDLLFNDLKQYTLEHMESARAPIFAAQLAPDETDFLQIFLHFITKNAGDTKAQDWLNESASAFLQQFPTSKYAPFVRRKIRLVYRLSDWGYGFSLGFGSGFVGGNMSALFQDPGAMDIGFDLFRSKLIADMDAVFYLRAFLGLGSESKQEFLYNGTWKKGLRLTAMIPEASVGLIIMNQDIVQVVPFVGISGILIEPPEEDRKLFGNDVSLDMSSYSFGLNVDWKLSSGQMNITGISEEAYWYLRSRVTYSAPFSPPDRRFAGNIVTVTVSIGGFGRSIVREFD
jgi:hypothetical protein